MKHSTFLSGTALALILAGPAQADVSASDVWEAWKASSAATGQTLTPGAETKDGSTLNVTDIAVTMQTESASVNATIPSVSFAENGDGTVSVTFADSYDMTIRITPDGGPDEVIVPMSVSQAGLTMIASGDPGAVNYDFEAPEVSVTITEITAEGDTLPLDVAMTLSGMAGTYTTTSGDNATMSSSVNADMLDIAIHMDEPEGGDGVFDMKLTYANLSTETDGAMAMLSGGMTELPAMLRAGGSTSATISHGAATYAVGFEDGRDAFTLNGTADTGVFEFALDADALSYDIGNTGLDMKMTGSEIPLPEVALTLGELGFGLLLPVSASEEPQDFGFALTLADLSVSEMIWGMVDPTGQIPHDPATLIFDVTGKANFLFDLFDPESMMEVQAPMPGEIHALTLNDMKLAIAGAVLSGMGDFTFDMDNLETFDGIPAPTGKLTLELAGANKLIDTLVSMGLLPEEQAMGARMMMGLFARPGDGEDTLVSEIEVDGASGAISANGQRIQ